MTRNNKKNLKCVFLFLIVVVVFLSNFSFLTKTKWSINYLHDVIFGEQRVDAEARHAG